MDERLKWLEMRINSSLKPRNEDLKNMFTNDDNRLAFYEFVNNEDIKRLFIYIRPPRQITASLLPPFDLKSKSIFFLKCNPGTKLTKDNIDSEVFYMDSTNAPLEHLELTLREVFLPLLGTNQPSVTGAGINGDKLMDILHRLMAAVEVTQGHVEGRIILSLPSIEVLAEVAAVPSRKAAVLHVLETTVIGWIKQIRSVLKHDPQGDLLHQAGPEPGPLDEVSMWEKHLARLRSINQQLASDVARDILHNLEQVNSQYAHSFLTVRKEISKAESETRSILKFLNTMQPWFQQLHNSTDPKDMLRLFKPLMAVLSLVWTNSVYYHQTDKFNNLLRLLSNEVVHRAIALVGEDILREPLESYTKLKEALRVCAAFRGTYLDFKDKADIKNAQNIAENAERLAARPHGSLFMTKMYGPHAYTPRYGLQSLDSEKSNASLNEEDLLMDSPWPKRNAPCFVLLNSFMERCNDVLELVETTRHFRLLAGAAEVGGAGSMSLDAMVKEIHQKYSHSMQEFFSVVDNVLSIDGTQSFERAFFKFRSVVKSLEKRLAGILRQAFTQCPTVESQLRLLEVFEGVSGREMVQIHLKDKDQHLVDTFTAELQQVREMFASNSYSPPLHKNMPPVISKLMWVHGLKERIKQPMDKMKQVSPHSLEGDTGWQMRDMYSECIKDLDKYENEIITVWQSNSTTELTLRLKQPLLIAEEFDEERDERPQVLQVNLDPQLLLLLREVHYLSQPPFNARLPPAAKELLRNTDSFELGVTATRLETIVSNYNNIMRTITAFEKPLFERKLAQIDALLEQGLQQFTWRMKESADFIESAMSLVCFDVHHNLDIVQTGCHEIATITISWSMGTLDIFAARQPKMSYSMEELVEMQKKLDTELESVVVPSGHKIHSTVQTSFEAVQISQASPAWQDYIDYIDAIVLDGLKQSTLASLRTMLNTLVHANLMEPEDNDGEDEGKFLPILTIRLELIENIVAFRPPLDQTSSVVSVQEQVSRWLAGFAARGRLVKMLGPKGSYEDYIGKDEEVKGLLSDITHLVEDNGEECKKLLDIFKEYSFLWQEDVSQTFESFLSGELMPNPMRTAAHARAEKITQQANAGRTSQSSRASSGKSVVSAELYENAERTFLTPKGKIGNEKNNVPSLDQFDKEIDIYKTARDEIQSLDDYHTVGWLRVDLQPIKQVLTTYASKWMWTFTKYLSDQVTAMLDKLDMFLKRIEPEIESITGEERDTASFMKMMRLFNEVSAQQSEMDGKFAAMNRTVHLLKKYEQILPEKTQYLFSAAPGRWNNLKTKVSLAKQRLGPRIQEESASISKDLETFAQRVLALQSDLESSDVYSRECNTTEAYLLIDNFSKRLLVLENEAQDLVELQELLETSIVNFTILPTCRHELTNLKQLWETVRLIEEQQSDWKRHRWQKMNTKFLREETSKQLEIVKGLPEDVFTWDVYMGLHESITTIQTCLPLIDDLSNPAMRTRHWKQLVRVTGGAFTIDNDTLKRMTLKELLSLGLQKHVDDVRAIVQRAVKDLAIEMSLKTYEEVWLSKIFELRAHTQTKLQSTDSLQDNQSEYAQSETGFPQQPLPPGRAGGTRATSRISNQSSHSKNKRNSVSSLPASLLNLGEDSGHLMLLTNTDPIFEELEHHQVTLQAMQSNSAAGSFLDEVLKWQKRLQTIEAVLTTWLEVQEQWIELKEVYSGADVRAALANDSNRFSMVNKDFRLLMRATEKNPNVLQCCSRKNILKILEHMSHSLQMCRKSLLSHLERRRQIFPRFYFLSMEDVLHIICNGYDLNQVNLYISKLFEHLGSLVFEEVDDNEKYSFIITGVDSTLGERLHFQQPVACEGQIETWLTTFLNQLKMALQQQLAMAMGVEKPSQLALANDRQKKPNVPTKPGSSQTKRDGNGVKSQSRNTSRQSQREAPVAVEAAPDVQEPVDYADRDDGGRSWTLEHVSEVVYLATQIQMSQQIADSIAAFDAGDSSALENALNKVDAGIQGTILLLKGLEGEREMHKSRQEEKEAEALVHAREDIQEGMLEMHGAESMISLQKMSSQESNAEEPWAAPPENVSTPHASASDEKSSKAAYIDTMNITLPALKEKNEYDLIDGGKEEEEDMKLMLFPSQIQKLTSLLSLLSHLRDLLQRLIAATPQQPPSTCFDWKSQLLYAFTEENHGASISCMKMTFEYGFEYQGSCTREVITPQTERMFVTMIQAMRAHMGVMCVGPKECGKFLKVRELSLCLGRPLYIFNCTGSTSYLQLQDIFRGLASTGCWVSVNDVTHLQPPVVSIFAQLMSTVMAALQQKKVAVHLQSEDIQLSPHAAVFALVDSAVPVTVCDPEKQLLYPSAISKLPENIQSQFRTVSIMNLDFHLAIEVMLFSQGFVHGRELARKTNQLYTMCRQMFGTNTYISDKAMLAEERSGSYYGWSLHSLKGVVAEAGAHMAEKTVSSGREIRKDHEDAEKYEQEQSEKIIDTDATKKVLEESALVTAIRDTFMPRMGLRDSSIFATIVQDLWPDVDVPMVFGGDVEVEAKVKHSDSFITIKSELHMKSSKSFDSQRSLKDSLILNTPVVPMLHANTEHFSTILDNAGKQVLENMQDAIAVATGDLGLLPGAAFQARVMQLAQLNSAHQSILVVGPPGCGKSECIKTYAVAERERGKIINVQSVFTKAVESQELMGYVDPKTKEWKEGLLTALLHKFCIQPPNINYDIMAKPTMKIMQLDGACDPHQMELLFSILNHSGSVVLANNERLTIPATLRFIWEMESLESMSPSLLASVGVLVMNENDVGWKLMLVQWLEHRNQADRDLLISLCDTYIERIVDYVTACTQPIIFSTKQNSSSYPKYKRHINHSTINMLHTFLVLLEALVSSFTDLSDVEYERYFSYAAVWAFGGTLNIEHRESFSIWWRSQFDQHIDYPEDGTVFDYVVDNESHDFCKWSDLVPSYTGTPHKGIPYDAFVHTLHTEQILHLLGVLTDANRPVMLVGENGCGKTAIVNERIRTVCSGEVAEVLSLTVYANRFTNARLLFERLDERLEWKHGRTHVPKGSKRLLCLVDDINLSQVDQFGHQTACELVREHLDDGGFYSPDTHTWRYVKNVTYVTTLNPCTTADTPKPSQRLLRHFAIFGCPYPGDKELQTIFSTLLGTHFLTPETSGGSSSSTGHHLSMQDEKVQSRIKGEEIMRRVVQSLVYVTVELHNRLRTMFLLTAQRCHYIFTARDLSSIFRNVCLSLQPACDKRSLLLLWQHECHWIYGRRMVNDVDVRRFRQAFVTAVRKQFIDDDQIQTIVRPRMPLFSNLMEQDSGVVTAGMIDARASANVTEEDSRTDLYRPARELNTVTELLQKGVEEYNKIHPRIKLALYKSVVELVCRLARTIASPHESANMVLVAEGCPGRASVLVKLAAHLCGFLVFQPSPIPSTSSFTFRMDQFKSDLVTAYTRAGTKGEKLVLLIHEEDMLHDDLLVFVTEFIVSCSISPLFTQEEQTTIINSIRTEVTQAGLTYTRDVAWNFFLRTVRNNCRMCLIMSSTDAKFQHLCRQYPSFTKNINFLWFPHWSKSQLIEHALHLLKGVEWMTDIQKENVAHMLTSMHLVLRHQDGGEKTCGEYRHITNTTFEKFVEKFITLANERHLEIEQTHKVVTKTLGQIQHENEMALKLKKQLDHEMVVLEERKAGTIKILSQIGQDTAITEQQIKVVKNQLEKMDRLKKLLPEYQVAHERAVFKAIGIVGDTKKVVKEMDKEKLAELRSTSKPSIEAEDLMAAIIMILKSPTADLTWQKGAKRQMANLDRFIDEDLMTFDDNQLPESTLSLVEPYLKKPSFDPRIMEQKTGNPACGSLCRWVHGVVRYHRMMLSKVKPLHQKVEETTLAVDSAQHKMNTLDNKRKALEVRLADLAHGFEEATIDKNEQEEKTTKMKKILDTAAQLRKILQGERQRCQQIFDSHGRRLVAIPGGCAMAAGLATYLGPYHHNFRRIILTIHWPNCLRERGIPLVIDSVDVLRGRVIDWSVDFLKTASGASSVNVDFTSLLQFEQENADSVQIGDTQILQDKKRDGSSKLPDHQADVLQNNQEELQSDKDNGEKYGEDGHEQGEIDGGSEKDDKEKPIEEGEEPTARSPTSDDGKKVSGIVGQVSDGEADYETQSEFTESSSPILTTSQYIRYVRSLIKLLVGEPTLNEWIRKDFGPRQIENAAILCSSWQRPSLMFDPNGEGEVWLGRLNKMMNERKLVLLDMENRTDPHIILTLERAITKGKPVILKNCEEVIDNFITPLIHHRNTANFKDQDEEPRMILFCGRRTLCHQDFRFYLSTNIAKPHFSSVIASTTTLINFGISTDTFTEDLLSRVFARIRPNLYKERISGLRNLQLLKDTLYNFSQVLNNRVLASGHEAMLNSPKSLQFVASITEARLQLADELGKTQNILNDLDILRDELYPIARRGAMLYAVLRSLASIRHEYQFTLNYFLQLFDEAVGGELPVEFEQNEEGGFEEEESVSEGKKAPQRPGSISSQMSGTEPAGNEGMNETGTIPEEESKQQFDGTEAGESTSASTGAAQRLVYGSDSEELPPIELPDTIQLPTPGVEYSSLSTNNIKQLMDSVTSLFYHRTLQSLLEEDHLLLRSLLCLNIQSENGEIFSPEELSLFIQGNPGLGVQLTLSDFGSSDSPPSWLPDEKWEDIMALSVLPGPLDSLCASFAAASESWQEWYNAPYPEQEPLPLAQIAAIEGQENKEPGVHDSTQEANINTPDLGPLSEFHQLLILRMLRPDRIPKALAQYTEKHLSLNDPKEDNSSIAEVLLNARKHFGVLLLYPASSANPKMVPESRLKLTVNPVEILMDITKTMGITMNRVAIGDGCEFVVEDAVHTAYKNDNWVLIEGLHLAPPSLFITLRQQLQRIAKSRATVTEPQTGASHFCAWMTCELDNTIPSQLIQHLHKVSWSHIISLGKPALSQPTDLPLHPADSYVTPQAYLLEGIVLSLSQVPHQVWEEVQMRSNLIKALAYAMAVIQGVLVSRQLFGSTGLTRWYPFGSVQIVNAIWYILEAPLNSQEGAEPSLDELCYGVGQLMYGSMLCNESDIVYVNTLIREILQSVYRDPASEIHLGTEQIPTPPANVAPKDYADWFQRTGSKNMTTGALQLSSRIEQQANEASAFCFTENLFCMYETQNMEDGDVQTVMTKTASLDLNKLRSALELCLEKLPPMLELGQVPLLVMQEFSFPYHRPSIISMSSASSDLMPESIGYVLLQECLWMNALLCYIRQQISELQSSLLGGPMALPKPHLSTVYSLQEEMVPISWIHPNCQPCTHSLMSWLDDLVNRHKQLHGWVKKRMVPVFDKNKEMSNPTIARGRLTSLWLGGLVNPQALLTAIRQEKAVVARTDIDQIDYCCKVINSQNIAEFEMDEGGLFINDVYLQGADWNYQYDRLAESRSALCHLPCLYVYPIIKSDFEKETSQNVPSPSASGHGSNRRTTPGLLSEQEMQDRRDKKALGIYNCPVYMNRSRQVLVCSLPVNCPNSEEKWILSSAAFILDRGLPEGATKKSRSYQLLQRLPMMQLMEGEEEEDFPEEEEEPEENDTTGEEPQPETGSEVSMRSQRSQLSYKRMSPQAPPLPVGLGLTREPAMITSKGNNKGSDESLSSSHGRVEPPLVSSRPTSAATAGSQPTSTSRAPRPPSAPRAASAKSQTGNRPASIASDKNVHRQEFERSKTPGQEREAVEGKREDPQLSPKNATHGEEIENEEDKGDSKLQADEDLSEYSESEESQQESEEKADNEISEKKSRSLSPPPAKATIASDQPHNTSQPLERSSRRDSGTSRRRSHNSIEAKPAEEKSSQRSHNSNEGKPAEEKSSQRSHNSNEGKPAEEKSSLRSQKSSEEEQREEKSELSTSRDLTNSPVQKYVSGQDATENTEVKSKAQNDVTDNDDFY